MLTGKRCRKLLVFMVMNPILTGRVCMCIIKNNTEVMNI
jgi:hypothetical protein